MSRPRRSLWVPLDVNFIWDPAVARCCRDGQLLYIRALCVAKQVASDGLLTREQVASICFDMNGSSEQATSDLLANGLWIETDEGYEIRSWSKHNKSQSDLETLGQKRAEAGRRGGQANRKQVASATGSKREAEKRREEESREVTPTPSPSPGGSGTADKVKGTRIPDPFKVTDEMAAWAAENVPRLDWTRETRAFKDFWLGKPGAAGRKVDWPATWRNWMRRANERIPSR